MPDIEHVPVYPSATGLIVDYTGSFPPVSKTEYNVPVEIDTVEEFYRTTLLQTGWAQTATDLYTWSSADPNVPFKFRLSFSAEILIDGTVRIHVVVKRWPDATKVPLYPDARNVTTNYEEDASFAAQFPGSDPLWHRNTTYTTSATPQTIADYYRSSLALPDWEPIPEESSIESNTGLGFRYFVDAPAESGEYQGGAVRIFTEALDGQGIQVKIVATGWQIHP